MDEVGKKRHSSTAMFLLFAEGCVLLLLSAAILTCGFVLDMHDSYDTDFIDSQVDYTQYWVGFVFLITSFVTAAVAVRQRNRTLVITALVLFLVCILVSLFALVVEGDDWVRHNTARRRKSYWEGEDDYSCSSGPSSCSCNNALNNDPKTISSEVDCDVLNKLTHIYGGIVCCVLIGVFVALSSIVIILILIPIKRFTLPEPRQRVRNITVLEDKPRTPPSPRIVYEQQRVPTPEVQDIVVREVSRRPPPQQQVIVREVQRPRPEPKIIVREVERPPPRPQVVVREVERPPPPRQQVIVREVQRPPPPPQVIVREVQRPPPPPQVIVREVQRPPPPPQVIMREVQRPPPQQRQRPQIIYDEPIPQRNRNLMAIEPARERQPTQRMISHVYDEGRLVTQPRREPPMMIEKDFVRNPNFVRVASKTERGRQEQPIYVQHRQPSQRREEWGGPINLKNRSSYVIENPPRRSRSRVATEVVHVRPRARSAERRPREPRTQSVVVHHQRPRSYSDERPRRYVTQRQPQAFAREVPAIMQGRQDDAERERVYSGAGAKPRVYSDKEIAALQGQQIQQQQQRPQQEIVQPVDNNLEDGGFESAANWDQRPPTPY